MLLVLTTTGSVEEAERLARRLLERRLAACCSIIPGLKSSYWWEGKIESSEEALLMVKTVRSLYREVEAEIKHSHPYEVPEIAAFPAEVVLPEYLRWLKGSVKAGSHGT